MPASDYIHPEFGFFCPTPRLRRRLRVALACLVVAGVGAAVMATADGPKLPAAVTRADEASIPETSTVRHRRLPTTHRRRRTGHSGQAVLRRRNPRPKATVFPSSCASCAWFGWRTIAQQSLPLLSAIAPLQRRAASMRRFSLAAPAPRATRRGRARQRSRPRARRSRRTLLLRPRTRKRRSRRAVRTIAATSTGMALRPGARSGSTIGQRAVTRQGSETTSGAHTVAEASRPISGKAGGDRPTPAITHRPAPTRPTATATTHPAITGGLIWASTEGGVKYVADRPGAVIGFPISIERASSSARFARQ